MADEMEKLRQENDDLRAELERVRGELSATKSQLLITKSELDDAESENETKDNLVLVYHADREANDGKKEAVAFFCAPSPVQSFACTGDQIGVGCQSGAVLHLRAPWLVET